MKHWLRKTHGPTFELLRHFLRSFFDSDLITTPGHMVTVLIGTLPVFGQWFFLLIGPLKRKYERLSQMSDTGLYQEALRADELWLITLMMSSMGLLTVMKWQALFPDGRDYRVLGTLPVGAWRLFAAKFLVLLLVASTALVVVNALPCLVFPALSRSSMSAHVAASAAGSAFSFFAVVGLQGVLLNVLSPRVFGRVAGYCQGILAAAMLGLLILSFSIRPQITRIVTQPEWSAWLPPVWFLGMHQQVVGLHERGLWALGIAATLAVTTYLVSYQRHRTLLMEGLNGRSRESRWSDRLAVLLARGQRQRAVLGFLFETVWRSRHHRTVLMAYGGAASALLLAGVAGRGHTIGIFVYYHMLALLFLLIAIRHVFALPLELKANWVFQITEAEGRQEWMSSVNRFVLLWIAVAVVLLPAPLEVWMHGVRGVLDTVLFATLGPLAYECAFRDWEKLPFTCSYLPGKIPVWMILAFFGLLGVLTLAHGALVAVTSNAWLSAGATAVSVALWWRMRRHRRGRWAHLRLCYDDLPEPAVKSLGLLR